MKRRGEEVKDGEGLEVETMGAPDVRSSVACPGGRRTASMRNLEMD
jgi:hypothetical protein